jgi:tetratricopeptide (TPR) repeat protein
VGREADDPWVGEDGRVRGALEDELARLRGADPLSALGLAPGAAGHEIRARFLALVKRYHPTRYARRPREVVRLANEVFLHIKAAYDAAAAGQGAPGAPLAARRLSEKSERLERLSPASQPKFEVDAALARRRRLRSYPVLPATGSRPLETPLETLPPDGRRQEERRARFQAAAGALRTGQLETAREAFRALLAEEPGDRAVRVHLHYTLGREHHAAGRTASARDEYERALALDPGFAPATRSLALLGGEPDAEGDGRGGLISRWFRR